MNPPLHSRILGQGKPLLILHGFLGMLDNWKTLGARYADAGLQVHLIDQRNHGSSFWSPEFSYAAMASDVKAYMDAHQLSGSMLLGHSMGGKTAMKIACDFPEKVDKLLVADIGPGYYPPHHQTILRALSALPLDQLDSRSAADKALAQDIPDFGTRQFLLKNLYWKEKGRLAFRCNLAVLKEEEGAVGEALDAAESYTGPTFFIRGEKSDYIDPADKDLILRHFPEATIQTLPGAGHWLHADQPDPFFKSTLDFLLA